VSEQHRIEYFFLQYAPDFLGNRSVDIALVLLCPATAKPELCMVRFASDWASRVRVIDPAADLDFLGALCRELQEKLDDPNQRVQILQNIDSSFSSSLRASASQERFCDDVSSEVDALFAIHLGRSR